MKAMILYAILTAAVGFTLMSAASGTMAKAQSERTELLESIK